MSLTQEVWKDMAGASYPELMRSKEAAMAHLSDPDQSVRIAAIHICGTVWDCSSDPHFLTICRKIAETDQHDDARIHAVSMLGTALQGTKDYATSTLLANLVKGNSSPEGLRKAAYWALREIQLGQNHDDDVMHSVSLIKELLRKHPESLSEDRAKQSLFGGGHFPNIDWETADQIDWNFVNHHAPPV